MAISMKSSQAPRIEYTNVTHEYVDAYNKTVEIVNNLGINQSTGVVGIPGSVTFTTTGAPILLESNFNLNIGDGTVGTIQLEGWPLYFSHIKTLITVNSLVTPIELTADAGYVYLTDTGDVIITSAPYNTYQPDKVRILRFYRNSDGLYSITIMPEFAGTPKLLRTITQNQPVLNLLDFSLQINSLAPLTFKRTGTKCLTEGAGCLSALDENILVFEDINTALLVDEGSNIDYTELDTAGDLDTYITKQLSLTFDGRLIVQPGTTSYTSLEEAIVELSYESFISVNGDTVGEFVPVVRIAHKANTVDLTNPDEAYMLDLTKYFSSIRTPVWYIK